MIRLRKDITFQDPQKRIREYCSVEIYRGYDDEHSINNTLSRDDVEAANSLYAMIDRYDDTESKRLLAHSKRISSLLSLIPNKEIYAISNEEWSTVRKNVEKLLAMFLSIRGFGLAKATKILHLKRPNLFPVLDSFVVKFLLEADTSEMEKSRQVKTGMQAIEAARKIMTAQKSEFEKLSEQLSDLPIPLTPIRMFDILCWTTEKWDIRGNPHAPYGTAHESLLKAPKAKAPTSQLTTEAAKRGKYVVFEDLYRATDPKVHHVDCFYYTRWINKPTSTTTWHGPYESKEEAWKICKEIASRSCFQPSKRRCAEK